MTDGRIGDPKDESALDALQRLTYRTEQLLETLEKRKVFVPLWVNVTLARAMELAKDAIEKEKKTPAYDPHPNNDSSTGP